MGFLPHPSGEVYQQQRQYDGVRKKLRDRGTLKHRIIFPTRLLLTSREHTAVLDTPADVEKYKELEEQENVRSYVIINLLRNKFYLWTKETSS